MDSQERRKYIEKYLVINKEPLKGQKLAEELGVTRQIIVKDIAILRASGMNIIATPKGYVISQSNIYNVRKILAFCHKPHEIEDELKTIVMFGGVIKDVIIEHSLYGEIRAMLMIKTLYDVENFINKYKKYNAEPLLKLTGGVHLHTIEAESEEIMDKIINELKIKGYLVCD